MLRQQTSTEPVIAARLKTNPLIWHNPFRCELYPIVTQNAKMMNSTNTKISETLLKRHRYGNILFTTPWRFTCNPPYNEGELKASRNCGPQM